MRKIKFRAWDKIHKEMSTWSSLYDNPNLWEYILSHNEQFENWIGDIVLMQFTGLTDKNGKEIYEGDLVAVADYANWEGLYKIIWDEKKSMYMLEDAFGDREKLCEFEEYLVKGNIYENPELLEGEQ